MLKEEFCINNGYFVFYLAFQVSQQMSLKVIKRIIESSTEVISCTSLSKGPELNTKIIKYELKKSFSDYLEERRQNVEVLISDFSKTQKDTIVNPKEGFDRLVNYTFENRSRYPSYLLEFDYTVTIEDSSNKWSIEAIDPLRRSTDGSIEEIINHSNALSSILGNSIFSNKESYLLSPIRLRNQEVMSYADVILELYKNNMAVIKVSIPFKDDMTNNVKDRSLCDLFEYSITRFNKKYLQETVRISDMNRHISSLINSIFSKVLESNNFISFEHIAVNNYSPVFTNSSQISMDVKREVHNYLYTDKFNSDMSNTDANDFWERNLVKINGCYFFFEESCRCLSLIGSECDRYNDLKHSESQSYLSAKLLDSTLSLWVPSLLFRKLSLSIMCRLTENNIYKFPEYKARCLINDNYVDQMSDTCSISTIDSFLKVSAAMKTQEYNQMLEKQVNRLEQVYLIKKEESKNEINRFVTTSAFIITVIFSLPTIKSTMSVFSTVFGLYRYGNLVAILSFSVWLVFLGIISVLFIMINKKLANKRIRSWFN
jgi:hypothetical protein